MKRYLVAIFLILIITSPVFTQAIEDPGPFPVGWRDVTFEDQIFDQGTVVGRIYYPALTPGQSADPDPVSGPYPLVGFQHGWLARPADYDNLCSHIASWGFVMASTGTETGLFPNYAEFAKDTRSYLHWIDAESDDPGSWLYGMASNDDWSASGHSMGGGTLSLLIGFESRVTTIVGLQAMSMPSGVDNMRNFGGRVYMIAGSVDGLVPPGTVHDWFEVAESASRNVYYEVEGMGHLGPTDFPPDNEPLSGSEQARLHRRLVTGLFRAEVYGEQDLYVDLLGEGIEVEPVFRETDCVDPVFWAAESRIYIGDLVVGLAGYPDALAVMAWSLVPDKVPTRFGVLGLARNELEIIHQELLPQDGWYEEVLPVQPEWSGQALYLQGLVRGGPGEGQLSRVVELEIP